ncbi:hypothetical protein D3C80_2080480 [compost metagenome]
MSQLSLRVMECLFGHSGSGDIHHSSYIFKISDSIPMGIAEYLHILDSSIRHQNTVFQFYIGLFTVSLFEGFFDQINVIWMSYLHCALQ